MNVFRLNEKDWLLNSPAPTEAILEVEGILGHPLPRAYKTFLEHHNGGEGRVPDYYVIFWEVGDLIEFNRDYEVAEYAPGIFVFGSNGGGEGYAFDMRSPEWPVVKVPFIGMSLEDALPTASNFADFLSLLEDKG